MSEAHSMFRHIPLSMLGAVAIAFTGPAGAATSTAIDAPPLALVARAGVWDVTETVWAYPGAPPQINTHLVAERVMVGPVLQETMREGNTVDGRIERVDFQTFNPVEGRWQYVSMDVRAPVGIMPATGFANEDARHVVVDFAAMAWPGSDTTPVGTMLRIEETIDVTDVDHDVKNQRFSLAGKSSSSWLAHRYSYVRHQGPTAMALR